jgi:Flp pilus assembly protein TadD
MQIRACLRLALALCLVVPIGACTDIGGLTTGSLVAAGERPQDEPVALGKMHYTNGDFGLAEKHFRAAVESNPKSAEAWLGLAATYDKLVRFDLAERAYKQVLALQGRTAAVLNNIGYHWLLRGNTKKARAYLTEAAALDPTNPQILGNLYLLETWKTGDPLPFAPGPHG